jgi:hypothetical protein
LQPGASDSLVTVRIVSQDDDEDGDRQAEEALKG